MSPFGLSKDKMVRGGGIPKEFPEGCRGYIASAIWLEGTTFQPREPGEEPRETGPSLEIVIQPTDRKTEKAQRARYGFGPSMADYQIEEEGELYTSELEVNENSGIGTLCSALEGLGVDFNSGRFLQGKGDQNWIKSSGFLNLECDWRFKDEKMNIRKREVIVSRFLPVKKYPDHKEGAAPVPKEREPGVSAPVETLDVEAEIQRAKDFSWVICLDNPASLLQVITKLKTEVPDLFMNAKVVQAISSGKTLTELVNEGKMKQVDGKFLSITEELEVSSPKDLPF